MKKKYCIILSAVLFIACHSPKEEKVERVNNAQFTLITDSIFSNLPGQILYQNNTLYWHDAREHEGFVHVVDTRMGKEIKRIGNIGSAPNEFTFPIISQSPYEGIYINDGNKPLESHIRRNKENNTFSETFCEYANDPQATRIQHLEDNLTMYLFPAGEQLFFMKKNGEKIGSFGERPIKEDINNAYDIFQGNIAYNNSTKSLIYSAIHFSYIAVYENKGNHNWELAAELKNNWDYSVNEQKLKFATESPKGAMEIATTKDFIVLLQRDEIVEGEVPKAKSPRDLSTLPHSLFLYDYDLQLKKIINMPFPMLRLCGDNEANTVYAIAANPEFELIKIKL